VVLISLTISNEEKKVNHWHLEVLVGVDEDIKGADTVEQRQKSLQKFKNFSWQDEPWVEFSSLEVFACLLSIWREVQQNDLT
jgi:hypothetical protein